MDSNSVHKTPVQAGDSTSGGVAPAVQKGTATFDLKSQSGLAAALGQLRDSPVDEGVKSEIRDQVLAYVQNGGGPEAEAALGQLLSEHLGTAAAGSSTTPPAPKSAAATPLVKTAPKPPAMPLVSNAPTEQKPAEVPEMQKPAAPAAPVKQNPPKSMSMDTVTTSVSSEPEKSNAVTPPRVTRIAEKPSDAEATTEAPAATITSPAPPATPAAPSLSSVPEIAPEPALITIPKTPSMPSSVSTSVPAVTTAQAAMPSAPEPVPTMPSTAPSLQQISDTPVVPAAPAPTTPPTASNTSVPAIPATPNSPLAAAPAPSVPVAPTAPSVPSAPTSPPSAESTVVGHKARIAEIKKIITEKVGNPVTLIDEKNEIGKQYMNALLAAMKAINSGDGSGADTAMANLESTFTALVGGVATAPAASAASATPVTVLPTDLAPAPAANPSVAPASPLAAVPTAVPSIPDMATAASTPATIGDLPPVPSAPQTASDSPLGAPLSPLQTPDAIAAAAAQTKNASSTGDPLMEPEVHEGLEQLLSDPKWKLFSKSGIFGTGPKGREHPLYVELASQSLELILKGDIPKATPEVRASIEGYVKGWKYEQQIEPEANETFEHYLRRVVRKILDAGAKTPTV